MPARKKPLPFDQVVEERRAKRFDLRSPAREREDFDRFSAGLRSIHKTDSAVSGFHKRFQRQRRRPGSEELIRSWTRGIDMLEDATDLLLERFHEASIVVACTSVEVILSGLLGHHIRASHFTKNRSLGEQVADQLLRNGLRDRVPQLLREAWAIDVKAYPQWKAWVEIQQGRNQIVHRGFETTLETAFLAVASATHLIRSLNSEIELKTQSDRSIPDVWWFLTADTTSALDDLDKIHAAVFQHLKLSPSQNLWS